MSKSVLLFIVIAGGVGYYLYKTNRFTEVSASFDYTPQTVSITARGQDLHDCKLNLTHDYRVDLPFLRQNNSVMIGKADFRQWNGTVLEEMKALGPEIEFKLRCKEGALKVVEANRYLNSLKIEPERKDEEVYDSK